MDIDEAVVYWNGRMQCDFNSFWSLTHGQLVPVRISAKRKQGITRIAETIKLLGHTYSTSIRVGPARVLSVGSQ